jgi:hypothetical protein
MNELETALAIIKNHGMLDKGESLIYLADREKFLMTQAMSAGSYYNDLGQWLGEVIDDVGHTVEQNLVYDANNIKN